MDGLDRREEGVKAAPLEKRDAMLTVAVAKESFIVIDVGLVVFVGW